MVSVLLFSSINIISKNTNIIVAICFINALICQIIPLYQLTHSGLMCSS
jgi:hypothetical protein